jgi:hypothetical protein
MSDGFYRVDITTIDRKGRSHSLHSFIYDTGQWVVYYPVSSRQYRRETQAGSRARHPSRQPTPGAEPLAEQRKQVDTPEWWEPRRPLGDLFEGDPLGPTPVPLADGVAPHGTTLAVILDAVRAHRPGPKVDIDLDRVRAVLSKQGGRITALRELPDDVREQATPALFAGVVRQLCKDLDPDQQN